MLTFLLFGSFAVFLIIGFPVSVSLGGSALITFLASGLPLMTIPQRMFNSVNSFTIMAIPLFILAGNLMTHGGISQKLVACVQSFSGRIRGSLGLTAVVSCAFFAALSGSGPATVIAIGSMLYPEMKSFGYPEKESIGLISVAGGLGPLIPPSIIMVVYASVTNASIRDLFTAGAFWGILIALALCLIVLIRAHRGHWPKVEEKVPFRDKIKKTVRAIPAILMPLIILGGIYGGIFTPTEAAGVSVVYAMIISLFVYREITIRDFWRIFIDSAKSSAMILFIIACSSAFAWLFTYIGISDQILKFVISLNMNATTFLVVVTILLTILGCFLDGISIVLLFVPLLFTVAQHFQINPVHFGMIVTITNSCGCMTPPVATNLFAATSISKLSIGDVVKGQMPYFITTYAVLFLIVFFPGITAMLI